MRILMVIDGMNPRDGGPPAVVAGSAEALRLRGLDIDVLTPRDAGGEEVLRTAWKQMLDLGVELHVCDGVGAADLLLDRDPAADIRALIDRADIVHLHGLWSPILISAARYARKTGTPYVISTHGVLDHRAMRRTWPKWIKKHLAVGLFRLKGLVRDAGAVIFGSEAEAQESWDMAPGMVRVFVPNGVSANVARSPVSAESREVIDQIAPQFAEWDRSLLFFSRIHPEKGLDMLVTAFHAVSADFPGTGLLVAGLRQDEAYLHEVEALIATGPGANRIVLTTELVGPKSHFLHSLCDIFVLPSHAEGFSVALIEALAHGMPCLITRFCHLPAVADEQAGVVVDPNPASIESGLRALLSLDADQLASMGANARGLFEARFTWDKVAEQLEEAYTFAGSASSRTAG